MSADYSIRPLAPDEVQIAVDWAAHEGWNPGLSDRACFMSVDPEGFWGGFLDGELIATISVVNYDEKFAFLGFYIVHPDHRGRGAGLRLWQAAVKHAGRRLIGLDGVQEEQANYAKSGFQLAYRNIRFGGPIGRALANLPNSALATPLSRVTAELEHFDRAAFPALRTSFLALWLGSDGHVARAVVDNGALKGYGVIRPCRSGYKIGPLFADTAQIARDLAGSLLASVPAAHHDSEVFLDVPEPNEAAMSLAGDMGLTPVFETARMYTGPAPDIAMDRIFGVTTFELG
ncbi:GNAT family N-acetyltransferase [Tropicibacter sp. R16_0]|uniref:GNAT family N-acetyltransferase n=1 Tax=Tropicibacter sp. R16_0 TaxID=2821102 RepID=UPI001ADCD6E6|nr:GNAT family N-acetyltransferase [Tropicibacter sp. R16_0]MBO9450142.1 GNAT family N-acetyltransferase [Tropicibacter sp. R16_0]